MLNQKLLENRIIESGKKYSHLAKVLGISTQYLRLKRLGKVPFTNLETDLLCKELGISDVFEKEKIFFSD